MTSREEIVGEWSGWQDVRTVLRALRNGRRWALKRGGVHQAHWSWMMLIGHIRGKFLFELVCKTERQMGEVGG